MNRVVVELAADRNRCGTLRVVDSRGRKICGPFAVAARASDDTAKANGNPARNPVLRFGDTPLGGYIVRQYLKSGTRTPFPAAQFGPHGVIVIEPISGEAAIAEANGRFHFLISGGDLSKSSQLRSTAGGLRLENKNMRTLFAALKLSPGVLCDVVDCSRNGQRATVFIDEGNGLADPVIIPARDRDTRAASRDILRGSASAVVIGMTVSFVALQAPSPAQASVDIVARSDVVTRDISKAVRSTKIQPGNYVQLAYGTGTPPANSTWTATQPDAPASTTGTAPNVIDGSGGQPITGAGVTVGGSDTPPGGAAPAHNALEQLQNATSGHQTTGQTFDNGKGVSDSTPDAGTVNVPTPSSSPVGGSGGDGTGASGSGGGDAGSGGPNAGSINTITGGGQPISGPGVHYGPADTPPTPNPVSAVLSRDQRAVSAAQAVVDAAIAERNAATTDQGRQQAQIKVYEATQELNRANGQLRADQINGN